MMIEFMSAREVQRQVEADRRAKAAEIVDLKARLAALGVDVRPLSQRHPVATIGRSALVRSPHANPIVEHMFQRFESGENLLNIGGNMFGLDEPDTILAVMEKLVLATVAPGTEYRREQNIDLPADIAQPLDPSQSA